MTNWLNKAALDSQLPDPSQAQEPETESVEQRIANDQMLQQMIAWFKKYNEASAFYEEGKTLVEERLKALGITNEESLPPEINEIFGG